MIYLTSTAVFSDIILLGCGGMVLACMLYVANSTATVGGNQVNILSMCLFVCLSVCLCVCLSVGVFFFSLSLIHTNSRCHPSGGNTHKTCQQENNRPLFRLPPSTSAPQTTIITIILLAPIPSDLQVLVRIPQDALPRKH